ncbi:MAG: ABC transporter ATP-binding protein [candidate division WOR-3 bacterium]
MSGIFRLLWKKKWKIATGIFILFAIDAAQLVVPLILRKAIDALAVGSATPGLITTYALWLVGLALFVAFFRFFWRYFLMGAARELERDLRDRIYAHVMRLHPGFFSEARTGDIMALATNDAEAVRMAIGMGIVASSDAAIMGLFSLGAMLWISPSLTIYTAIPLAATTAVVLFFGKAIYKRFKAVQEAFAEITERVRETISGIRIIKAFVQEDGERRSYRELNEDYVAKNMSLVKIWGFFWPLVTFFAGSATALVIWQGGAKAITGAISLGDVVAFMNYLWILVWPMVAIGWVTNLLQRGSASMARIQELLDTKPEIADPQRPHRARVKGNIEFRGLTFSYSEDGDPVLIDVDLSVEEGMVVGIVGRTGSGKTTLVSLVPRLYDPPPGTVFVDGVDVRNWSLEALRGEIGFVPQEAFLFSATIRENIAFFNPDAPEEDVVAAANAADIWHEIEEMPDGLDTVVGERGITLSGGQRQRVALARAIIKDPRIIILDDTLSAVDFETEERILDNLKRFLPGRTGLIISHRLSAVAHADLIIVLEDGRVVEKGTHQELLRIGGIYAKTWELQQLERAAAT